MSDQHSLLPGDPRSPCVPEKWGRQAAGSQGTLDYEPLLGGWMAPCISDCGGTGSEKITGALGTEPSFVPPHPHAPRPAHSTPRRGSREGKMTIKSVWFNPVRRPGPFKRLLILPSSAKKGRHLLLFRQSSKPTAERHRLVFPTPASAQHQASLVMRTVASLVAGSINTIQPA